MEEYKRHTVMLHCGCEEKFEKTSIPAGKELLRLENGKKAWREREKELPLKRTAHPVCLKSNSFRGKGSMRFCMQERTSSNWRGQKETSKAVGLPVETISKKVYFGKLDGLYVL